MFFVRFSKSFFLQFYFLLGFPDAFWTFYGPFLVENRKIHSSMYSKCKVMINMIGWPSGERGGLGSSIMKVRVPPLA